MWSALPNDSWKSHDLLTAEPLASSPAPSSRHTIPPTVDLPSFDMHAVEESLLISHRQSDGVPMTREQAREAIALYLEFLRNHKANGMPEPFEFPGLLVDRVWHTHICETRQYRKDCMQYFGKFFHHASGICDGGGAGQP